MSHLQLSRRIVTYYLLFCLGTMLLMLIGTAYAAHSLESTRTETAGIASLRRAASRIEIEFVRSEGIHLQDVVDQVFAERRLAYCAVVSNEQTYLAHSDAAAVGATAVEPAGTRDRLGDIDCLAYVDAAGNPLRRYGLPLVANGNPIGTLFVAVADTSFSGILAAAARFAPIVVLAPTALIIFGAIVLRRHMDPLAEVDVQLRTLAAMATDDKCEPKPVTPTSATALGWNRMIDLRARDAEQTDLESRIAEAIAARSQSHNDVVLNSLSDGIAVTDAEGRIEFANQAIAALLGESELEQTLQGTELTAHLGDDESVQAAFADPAKRDRTTFATVERSNASGRRVLRTARQPIRAPDGSRREGYVWSIRDVTQQRLAEQMRNQFLDSATHELRTPLANIRAYAETLALSDMLDVEKQKEFCNTINAEATRLARFIDDLLSISSMEVGSLSIDRKNVEVHRLLNEVVAKVQPLMDQKQIAFDVVIPEKIPELKVDKDKIIATLVNLLGNAAKYTPDGGRAALKVKLNEDHLEIDVEDTGVGISDEELPRIFDKFFRSDDPRVQNQTGTGLGLSLAQEIVRLHGGRITVSSTLNQGSTFTISLPAK